jgi:sulfopyruvate decarboxylase alpha subunit
MEQEGEGRRWHRDTMAVFRASGVRQVAHVPDAGLSGLIRACDAEPTIETTSLTTEEEGVALLAGAWLGGDRGCLLMQSSGVGNIVNMLSIRETCRFPLVMIVTMRGEWAEFNPWQIPMGRSAETVLRAAGVDVRRAEREDDVGSLVEGAMALAHAADLGVAVLISQRLIGAKTW